MKLTNTIRNAFINSVMNDVPNYNDLLDAVRKLVVDDIVSRLPKKIRAVYDDKDLRHWLKTDYNSFGSVSLNYPSPEVRSSCDKPMLTPEVQEKVNALEIEIKEKRRLHRELQSKIKSAAYGCTTRKQLAELLPEFEKYLPADEAKAVKQNLPAVANLVADFTKAGWPKSKKAAA